MFRYKILIFLFFFISCSKDSTLFKVEIKSEPDLGGTINFPTDLYAEGEILELKATPSKNFKFLSWSGDASGSDSIVRISVTNDKKIFQWLNKYRNHGMLDRDHIEFWGVNSRLQPLQAIVASNELKNIPKIIKQRNINANYLDRAFLNKRFKN